ncbi:valine--tRNA ligase [Blastococcus sp. Marseille-P5729]|uniref:valine--tRNA ligase n=1 Tax=Blastococcus sp. Marseille-P5729 TaxID=2086582 RepID=UPI000D10028C|nr:valine--tRNA ligase [Blastococcus sp. Marseille-P5729]
MTSASPGSSALPEKPTLDGVEAKLVARWESEQTYAFDRTQPRENIFAIDTPPPTASGALHIGHVFSYTHTDTVARFWRMRGKAVFYPIGWDDNGLPSEKRVQNFYGVRCDTSVPYDPDFTPPEKPGKQEVPISRRNFLDLCEILTVEDEKAFENVFRTLGASVDWSMQYRTIDDHSQATSQRAFLRNLSRGEAYNQQAPTLWDVTFRTAVAQAELEDRERQGNYFRVGFAKADGEKVFIETTRPELLPACVALVAHPDDERYVDLFGHTVTTPVFGVEVPVVAHELADPEKGSGIAMICTWGDTTDVTWWRELQLPARAIIGRDGRLIAEAPEAITSETGRAAYADLAGLTPHSAKQKVVEQLTEAGAIEGEPKPTTQQVKFYERGERPLEIVSTRQWYIRNGGREAEVRDRMIQRGRDLRWVPEHMRHRYENWVEGLAGDWLISRQRFFGIPIPLWYRLDDHGEPDYDDPIVPDEATLPIDPSSDVPPGFEESQRGQSGGFVGDPDVMDTWATSSLTPQIAGKWGSDDDLFQRVFPMDVRPQGHDIIRTWLFSTVVRSELEFGVTPWKAAALSGWILDPDRKKMSKSKGNVVTPIGLLEQYGSDAVRYWAASGRPGTDTAFDEAQMKVGRRLATKILNASKFALGTGASAADADKPVTEPLDLAMLAALADVVDAATKAFEDYNYAVALERTESFFWSFCDNYVELVKSRSYGEGPGADSAKSALSQALSVLLRLFAPILPFVTEEVWSWWQQGSIHLQSWPESSALRKNDSDAAVLDAAIAAIAGIRKAKSEAGIKGFHEVAAVRVTAPNADVVRLVADDLKGAARAASIEVAEGAEAGFAIVAGSPSE